MTALRSKHSTIAQSVPEIVSRGQPWWAQSQTTQDSEASQEGPDWILVHSEEQRCMKKQQVTWIPFQHSTHMAMVLGLCCCSKTEGWTTREVKGHGQLAKALRMHFILHFSIDFKHPPHGRELLISNTPPCQRIDWNLSAHKQQQRWPKSEGSFKAVPETHPSFATRIRTEALQPFPRLCNGTDPFGKVGFLTHPNSQLHNLKYQHSSLLYKQSKTGGHQSPPVNQAGCV